jgi:hypothetical protein
MRICMQTPLLSLLLNLMLSVEKVMLPIEDLMVDGGCIATTGGRRLFCLYLFKIMVPFHMSLISSESHFCPIEYAMGSSY